MAKEQNFDLEQISPRIYLLKDAGALVSFSDTTSVTKSAGNAGKELKITYGNAGSAEIRTWGNDNLLPQQREALVLDNNIVPELIGTKRDITVGGGLMYYQERFESGADGKKKRIVEEEEMPKAAMEFFSRMEDTTQGQTIDQFLLKNCRNLMFHANLFVEYIRDKNGAIFSMEAMESRHVRPEKMRENGVVMNWYWSGDWKNRVKPEYTPQVIPAYRGEMRKQPKFLYHAMDDVLCDDYLGIPTWWGGRAWIECANAIPVFHISNLRNGYTLRWHIEIPTTYFSDMTAAAQTQAQKTAAAAKETEARQIFIRKLNDFLAGAEQAGRALITEYEINKQMAKDYPGIKVTALNVDIKDEALLKLFAHSNDANISAQGIHPTLAAIQTQGKLSSGSEIRNAFTMYVAIKTPVKRAVLLRPINLVDRINGWSGKSGGKWGFRDIEITKLDEDPAGQRQVAVGA